MLAKKGQNRLARKRRIRARISGNPTCPRLTVFRSLTQMSVQVIDDESGKTIISVSTKEAQAMPTIEGAKKLGVLIAKKAKENNIERVVFDRNAYSYHGRVKALADAAREGGLSF